MIIDSHSPIGDPWYAYGKEHVGMDFPAYRPGPEISKVREGDITEGQKRKIRGGNAARLPGPKA